jgi:hypothetical protein
MFIVQTKDGKTYTESKEVTWDSIPKDVEITSLSLTSPYKIRFQNSASSKDINPKFTIKNCEQYYFMNESVVTFVVINGVNSTKTSSLTAKIIGCVLGENVFEYRMDKHGNINMRRYTKKELSEAIKNNKFNKAIIRKGV